MNQDYSMVATRGRGAMMRNVAEKMQPRKHDKSEKVSGIALVVFAVIVILVVAPKIEATSTLISDNLPAGLANSINSFSDNFKIEFLVGGR